MDFELNTEEVKKLIGNLTLEIYSLKINNTKLSEIIADLYKQNMDIADENKRLIHLHRDNRLEIVKDANG